MTMSLLLVLGLLDLNPEEMLAARERAPAANSDSQLNVAIDIGPRTRALWLLIKNRSTFAQRYCLTNVSVSGPTEGFSGRISLHSCADVSEFRVVLPGEAAVFVHPFPADLRFEPLDELLVTTSLRIYAESDTGDRDVGLKWRGTTKSATDLLGSLVGR